MTPEDINYYEDLCRTFRRKLERLYLACNELGSAWDDLDYFYHEFPELQRYEDVSTGTNTFPFDKALEEVSWDIGDWYTTIDEWSVQKLPVILKKLEQQSQDSDDDEEEYDE